ncbi:hypothetical protein PF011_g7195 [Phytophthora fragariae]|uniref:Secreted protein n=1 Tax=Phytophthora fragariae TaxID=53985 RepID=A0A6A3LKH1_9STRA|nr:hypothetical protein PF011_g7195 [Phytophthora fragariae]
MGGLWFLLLRRPAASGSLVENCSLGGRSRCLDQKRCERSSQRSNMASMVLPTAAGMSGCCFCKLGGGGGLLVVHSLWSVVLM